MHAHTATTRCLPAAGRLLQRLFAFVSELVVAHVDACQRMIRTLAVRALVCALLCCPQCLQI